MKPRQVPRDYSKIEQDPNGEWCFKCKTYVPTILKNHSPMWGDGEVCCKNCQFRIRYYDSG